MARFNVEHTQNVEVSKKFPCEKSPDRQLEVMEQYTAVHCSCTGMPKELREIACLRVLYPALFRSIMSNDRIAGRIDFLPIGFGSVTSEGGVGHYCVFKKLAAFRDKLEAADRKRVDVLYDYWLDHDVKTLFNKDILTDDTIGMFIDCEYPMIATARLSGMMLDYPKLLGKGIGGLRREIEKGLLEQPGNSFYEAGLACLDLFVACATHLQQDALQQMKTADDKRRKELQTIYDGLENIKEDRPETFHEALQLIWLYALLAGVINYGRLDDYLGPYLAADLETGRLTDEEAYSYVHSLWTLIENRRTTVNGRVIVGGKGRKHPKEADVFLHYAMRVARNCRYVEPQFTLRFDKDTSEEIWDAALDALGAGATYPTLYNDDVNVPAVAFGMRIDEQTAEQYVPFGCTEFVIQGQSTGTPNICINLLKLLTIFMNEGIDPVDGKYKAGKASVKKPEEYHSFEDFYNGYKALLDHYLDLSVETQYYSYQLMNKEVGFLFNSLLTDDCIARGKTLLDGGVRYLGGTNETYGNINTSDSLWVIKDLVFERKKYTLRQLHDAMLADFVGYDALRKDCLSCDKYGNDLDTADGMANDLYEFVAKGVRDRGIRIGMQYFLIVISNNQLNTEWGNRTAASPDGRLSGMYMNPANNPQGGANVSGPTALLNSLTTFDPRYHGGSVQNIKFTPAMFNENRALIKQLFHTYFNKGGCHLMVTVVDKGVLEDAMQHPENYPDLIVRVSGFSAVFVDLSPNIQEELLSRVLYDGDHP
ncbi:pyruvate-formate lyase [Parabacteroides sp. PF5-5]|uniref:pyruvate formate lyase family protein n=1 Tax=unclassified Parabacteroides TaxID=2649774 RepID=UPI00247680BC|nr:MULTISPECIES: pyruvate formate lyase family protein [unclassified Parabacteroides]MDH6305427.1 pyruvate-formate lyase [Parabacteroides sp. PH5-39]MDH6316137.1 pyruvate-formate lyase [Parabacteroides sp. PF5-13]MDH6320287.1 pyruvate-formate lyase [Parabacteroides sp. PH5-13]MDH6324017.1 pyruvate-formate lyase [Parabacteroides sp. PH5-8]MDH6327328.1 pyruvate-formate lyase [Parabacteroides sp. PH5-41]